MLFFDVSIWLEETMSLEDGFLSVAFLVFGACLSYLNVWGRGAMVD
jgi:hypothetical protein